MSRVINDVVESHGSITVRKYSKKENKWITIVKDKPNLLANEGRDHMHAQNYTNSGAGTRGFNLMALSSDANGVSASHTAKGTGSGDWDASGMEITASGLARTDVTSTGIVSHTAGTNQTTLDNTFENTSGATVNDVQKVGLFNDTDGSGSEILGHEASFTPQDLDDGDKLQVIYTVNLG